MIREMRNASEHQYHCHDITDSDIQITTLVLSFVNSQLKDVSSEPRFCNTVDGDIRTFLGTKCLPFIAALPTVQKTWTELLHTSRARG